MNAPNICALTGVLNINSPKVHALAIPMLPFVRVERVLTHEATEAGSFERGFIQRLFNVKGAKIMFAVPIRIDVLYKAIEDLPTVSINLFVSKSATQQKRGQAMHYALPPPSILDTVD